MSNPIENMKTLMILIFIMQQQGLAYYATGNLTDSYSNTTLYTYVCDDEKLEYIEDKLNRIVNENENLHLKLDSLNTIINNQFAELKSTYTMDTTNGGNYSEVENNCPLSLPTSCAEAFKLNEYKSGIHQIHLPDSKLEPFYVYCLADSEKPEAPWTIIQRRQDGSIDFYRKWADYQKGFGNLEGEFFIGLDILHALTQSTLHELWIHMVDYQNVAINANYSSFAIGDASEAYALKVLGLYKGDAGDSLTGHAGHKFTTKDVDNDILDAGNCANDYTGAWWYTKCHASNLNGQYLGKDAKGVVWHDHSHSLKYVHMALRPVNTKIKC